MAPAESKQSERANSVGLLLGTEPLLTSLGLDLPDLDAQGPSGAFSLHPFFSGFVQSRNATWARTLFDRIWEASYRIYGRSSKIRRAQVALDNFRHDRLLPLGQKDPWVQAFATLESKIRRGDEEFLNTFEDGWNELVSTLHHGLPTCIEMFKVMGLNHGLLNERIQKAAPKPRDFASGFWRAKRSRIDAAGLSAAKLANTATRLEQSARHDLANRGLSHLASIKVIFDRTQTPTDALVDVEGLTVILAQRLLERPWRTLKEVIQWAYAHLLAAYYQSSRASFLDRARDTEHAFQLAWKRLGMDVPPSSMRTNMDAVPANWRETLDSLTDAEKRYLERVDKLFSLAGSSNEHEASLAMQRASEMLRARNLQRHGPGTAREAQSEPTTFVTLTLSLGCVAKDPLANAVASLLRSHFFVYVVYSDEFDVEIQKQTRTIELLGRRENVLLAEHAFDFLMQQAESLWTRVVREGRQASAKAKKSYQLGLIEGFREKMRSQQQSSSTRGDATAQSALIRLEFRDIEDYVATVFPKLSHRSSSALRLDEDALEAGKSDGRAINIHAPLKSSSPDGSQGPRFLGSGS